ncbi:MAG: uroporphyrinogen-III C-methyltransferase [bacterium]
MTEKETRPSNIEKDLDAALASPDAVEAEVESGAEEVTPKGRKGGGAATGLSLLALLVAGGGVAGGYYVYKTQIEPLQTLPVRMSASLDKSQQSSTQRIEGLSVELRQQLDEEHKARQQLAEKLSSEDEDLRAAFGDISDDLAVLKNKANWGQREWSLAEISYLLRMADDRLTYMRDVDTVKAALRTAARRIDILADPVLVPLRQQLRNDLQALNAYEVPDATRVLTRLEGMVAVLKPFPVSSDPTLEPVPRQPPKADESSSQEVASKDPEWKKIFYGIKDKIAQRIRVVRHDEPLNALSHDTVARYQLEMLGLRIEALRLALMREDGAAFRRELLAVETWVGLHLPEKQAAPIRAELENLRKINPFQPLPSLKASRAMLRELLSEPEGRANVSVEQRAKDSNSVVDQGAVHTPVQAPTKSADKPEAPADMPKDEGAISQGDGGVPERADSPPPAPMPVEPIELPEADFVPPETQEVM